MASQMCSPAVGSGQLLIKTVWLGHQLSLGLLRPKPYPSALLKEEKYHLYTSGQLTSILRWDVEGVSCCREGETYVIV